MNKNVLINGALAFVLLGLTALVNLNTANAAESVAWIGNMAQYPANTDLDAKEDLWINIETWPKGSAVSSQVNYKVNNGNWTVAAMALAGQKGNNDWWHVKLGQFNAGDKVEYAVGTKDGNNKMLWDNNASKNYVAEVKGASVTLAWAGELEQFPLNVDLDPNENLWVNIQTWPKNSAYQATAYYKVNGGPEVNKDLNIAGVKGNNDWWHVDLGKYAAGDNIVYRLVVKGGGNVTIDLNNNGANYTATVKGSTTPLAWAGNPEQYPVNNDLDANEDLWINVESWPKGAATSAEVHYKLNTGAWQIAAMDPAGAKGNNDLWHVKLGKFASKDKIEYAIGVKSAGPTIWVKNGAANFIAQVKETVTINPLVWIGNVVQFPANADLDPTDNLWLNIESYPKTAAVQAEIHYSVNGGGWIVKAMSKAGEKGNNDWWNVDLGKFAQGAKIKYALRVSDATGDRWANNGGADYEAVVKSVVVVPLAWIGNLEQYPINANLDAGDDLWFNIETYPKGSATSAKVVYSKNGGTWTTLPMTLAGQHGNNDWWHVKLSGLVSGDKVQYALSATDGVKTLWDNNGTKDYTATVK